MHQDRRISKVDCFELIGQEVNSGNDGSGSGRRVFAVLGTPDKVAAVDTVDQFVGLWWGGMRRESIKVIEKENEYWEASVIFKAVEKTRDDIKINLDITAETIHQTHAIKTLGRYAAGEDNLIDFGSAIGVEVDSDGSKRIAGTDITVPKCSYGETHKIPAVSTAWVRSVARSVGTVNTKPFRAFAPGELLFVGARGSKDGPDDWAFQFSFLASENMNNFDVGPIRVSTKRGFDYLWVYWQQQASGGILVPKPRQVNVVQTYLYKDFPTLLGIS